MAERPVSTAFVGRTRELAELTQALESSTTGRGQLVLLAGEPGIGKTRLTEELATIARQRDTTVLVGRCWEGDGAPAFWPWVQITRAYLQHSDPGTLAADLGAGAPAIAHVIPEVRERLPHLPALSEIEPAQARFRFFDSFTLLLKRVATTQPILLVLDDLHWADTPSLLLLQFLARELTDMRVLVVGTYRDTEVDRAHLLSEALGALARESQRIALVGLSVEEVAELITRTTDTSPSASLSHAVHAQTEGNPFFISELLRLLDAEGRLTTPTVNHGRVPQAVQETIRRRLARLSPSCQQMLTVAAVIGREFDTDVLGKIRTNSDNLDRTALLSALQDALTARLIHAVEEERGRYRFVHALVRETLYENLPLPQRTELHRHVGEAMEGLYAGHLSTHLDELADHFFKAAPGGVGEKAFSYALQAGEHATATLAYEEAVTHYARVLQLFPLQETTESQRCECLLALGSALAKAGEAKKAREAFQQAAAVVRELHLQEKTESAAFLLARAALGFAGHGDVATRFDQPLISLLEEALTALSAEDSTLRVRVLSRLAMALYFSPFAERRDVLSRQAIDMARRLGETTTLASALNARHMALLGPDTLHERLALATDLTRLTETAGRKELALGGHLWRLMDVLELGDRRAVDLELQTYARLAAELRQPFYLWQTTVLHAMQATLEGRFAEGEQLVQEGFALGQRAQTPNAFLLCSVQLFALRREQGRFQELEEAFKMLVERYPAIPALRPALAFLYSELGREAEARGEFDRLAANDFADLLRDQGWFTGMALLAQVAFFLKDTSRAATLYIRLLPYADRNVIVGSATDCYGSVARYLGLLATTMARWDTAARHFTDALAANTRLRTRPFVAHTQYDYAQMLLARGAFGDNEQAVTFFDQALATARELGMVRLEEKIRQSVVSSPNDVELRTHGFPNSLQTSDLGLRTPDSEPSVSNTFHRESDNWVVSYERVTVRLRDAKGFRHLATLLREPGREFHVVDLLAETDHEPATIHPQQLAQDVSGSTLAPTSALPDHQARTSYRQRLADVRDQLAEAERFNDAGRIATLRSESEFLTHELSTRYGISHHARKSSTEVEKARKAVAYRIRSVLTKLKKAHPVLWRHLHLTIKTGVFCSYNPEKPTTWQV